MTERETIEETQKQLAAVKKNLRNAARNLRAIAKINREAGRLVAAHAANRMEGVVTSALGDVIKGHADASDSLIAEWPDYGAEIATRGGGR